MKNETILEIWLNICVFFFIIFVLIKPFLAKIKVKKKKNYTSEKEEKKCIQKLLLLLNTFCVHKNSICFVLVLHYLCTIN